MAKTNRDDFTEKTKLQIAKRAGWLCSYPACRTPTIGATSDGQGEINVGTAAHICAAARGGPRYDPDMSPEDRSSANNGIWMCRDHGKAIDSNDPEFSVKRLREWKRQAEQDSWRRVLRSGASPAPAAVASGNQSARRLRTAAEGDLTVFRRTAKWPSTSVSLTLKVEDHGEPATTSALASAATILDDLILVAAPGMGKTTTLFQIAEGVLASGSGTPLVVPLGDWATDGSSILDSILRRPAFRGISEDDFRVVAATRGVVLLLDGWNELDGGARERARVQVTALKAELPELGLVVSTRRQALDVPFVGKRVDLLPLNEMQQLEIATAMRGEAGARIVDQAWRTAGIRELVSIPLYLTALLSLPQKAPFPTTKEEVLRHFVAAHEKEARRAEALRAVAQGFQLDYLDGLAAFATRTGNTAIADSNARRSVFETEALLMSNGQITVKPQPDAVLDVLVSNHVLMRAGDTPGYSFQHQQFQEWYASHSVERRIMAEVGDPVARELLKAEVFNPPAWEEAILFAIERLARGDAHQRTACGKAILAAFEVDPILAAEMIYRSTEKVWTLIAATTQGIVARWHASAKVDRALRFMLTCGRPEFLDLVWPLITQESEQISLAALRNCRRFRPSLLGKDAEKRIRALPLKVRTVLLHEIAMQSGMDGLDLATIIATHDPDPEVRATVAGALAFRRADRHVVEVLRNADEKTFDLVARKHLVEEVDDEGVKEALTAARERQITGRSATNDRLRAIVYADGAEDRSEELTAIIREMKIERRQDEEVHLVYEARNRYPRAVAEGVLARVRTGRTLFYGADDILAAAGFSLEDEALLELALASPARHDDRSEAAASVLGPEAVGRMIDAVFDVGKRLRDESGKFDRSASDMYIGLQTRIAHTRGTSLVAAVHARSGRADNEQIARLADLLSRHPSGETDRGRPLDAASLATIQALVQEWANRMLTSGDAKRSQAASIATLASQAPSVGLLPVLKRLLDDNLRRYREFREEAKAAGWRHGNAVDEARTPHMHEYQRAFLAITEPETVVLMQGYLADEHFGEFAAGVLVAQWIASNEPQVESKRFRGGVDFSRVEEKRAAYAADPAATSAEAEAIFAVIEPLMVDGATEDQKRHAVVLGIAAARLPHGERGLAIQKLVALAPRRSRAALLLKLVLSGHIVDIEIVKRGFADVMEAGKAEPWILADGYEVKEWLRLLPFTNRPAGALAAVQSLADDRRTTDRLEELIEVFGFAPGEDAEKALFALAEAYPAFYANNSWRNAVLRRGTLSAAQRLVDLAATGMFAGQSPDRWHIARQIAGLIGEYPVLRDHVYRLLKSADAMPVDTLLAEAVAENPDTDGLLLLLALDGGRWRSLISWRTIQSVISEQVPAEDWEGAYSVVPVPAVELRQKLLAMTSDGGPSDAAARCLNEIDKMRDESGAPEGEPRHPDLASGKPWPIMTPDPDATEQG